jgi:hypothetical protein
LRALFDPGPPYGAILRDNAAVGPLVKFYAQSALAAHYQVLSLVPGHIGEVVNIQLAVAAKSLALVAVHLVPVNGTRTGYLDII